MMSGARGSETDRGVALAVGGSRRCDDAGDLSLRLGVDGAEGVGASLRPLKRVRSMSGGPFCQVHGCSADLSGAKDYHRRHKVCGVHSKASEALVGKVLQRFCQQCSRFHPLQEFDEGKRSCRRRLAGHNQRRRKVQPEETMPQLILDKIQHNHLIENSKIINMLSILTQSQDASRSIEILMANAPLVCRPPAPVTNCDIDTSPLTLDLLSVRSSAVRTSDTVSTAVPSKVSSESRDESNGKKTHADVTSASSDGNSALTVPPVIFDLNTSAVPSSVEAADLPVHVFRPTLQLFGSAKDESPDKQSPSHCIDTTTTTNPLFSSECFDALPPVNANQGHNFHKVLCKDFERRGDVHTASVFDRHHPQQERTDRILFKLFNKDSNDFPAVLRNQILEWLSLSPSEMEIYMRPGCVILSLYLSMPSVEWDKLHTDLLPRVHLLLQDAISNFWRSSNFLLHLKQQIVSHNDGKVNLLEYHETWTLPELLLVSPLAIVSGKKENLQLMGRNLRIPGTRIHCTYMNGYSSREVSSYSSCVISDDWCYEHFVIPERPTVAYGRCFIEVENDLRGNAFPVIIADDHICQELRILEAELIDIRSLNNDPSYPIQDSGRRTREEILQFLNELGWLFQRSTLQPASLLKHFSSTRFKMLLLFAVVRDWPALVKKILDIVVERNIEMEDLTMEFLEALGEVQPLTRAVEKKSKLMVKMLLSYSVDGKSNISKVYLFPPNLTGHGGISPLHIAASMEDSEEMVDALTDDPQEIGLKCWSSLLDHRGLTPYAYAQARNLNFYNDLVARKLADRMNNQVSINVEDSGSCLGPSEIDEISDQPVPQPSQLLSLSCAQCAAFGENGKLDGFTRYKGAVYRPYVHSLLAIATVCMCVSMLLRGAPDIDSISPFKWERIEFGIM